MNPIHGTGGLRQKDNELALPLLSDEEAAKLRSFGPLGILSIAIIFGGQFLAPLGAVLVLVWAKLSRTPWWKIGFASPKSWTMTIAGGVVFGTCLKLFMKSVLMPLLGADPINHSYHFLAGNRMAALTFIPIMIIKAGFGEETFFRGYLFERLEKLAGETQIATIGVVGLTSLMFAVLHFDQGIAGIEQALVTGVVFGSIFAITRQLWLVICAHAAFDLAAVALIYWGLEAKVAHAVFN
jgi:membrane protease YdiL (CAAX protease family)